MLEGALEELLANGRHLEISVDKYNGHYYIFVYEQRATPIASGSAPTLSVAASDCLHEIRGAK